MNVNNLDKIIKNKKDKCKNCKFFVITSLKIDTDIFLRHENLKDIISINGIMNDRYKTLAADDPHLNYEGNLFLSDDLYKIITNEN
jgi:hypothetical protein